MSNSREHKVRNIDTTLAGQPEDFHGVDVVRILNAKRLISQLAKLRGDNDTCVCYLRYSLTETQKKFDDPRGNCDLSTYILGLESVIGNAQRQLDDPRNYQAQRTENASLPGAAPKEEKTPAVDCVQNKVVVAHTQPSIFSKNRHKSHHSRSSFISTNLFTIKEEDEDEDLVAGSGIDNKISSLQSGPKF